MGIKDFLWKIALRKGVTQAVISWLGLIAADSSMQGVDLSAAQEVLLAVVVGSLNTLRNYLKHKQGIGWL